MNGYRRFLLFLLSLALVISSCGMPTPPPEPILLPSPTPTVVPTPTPTPLLEIITSKNAIFLKEIRRFGNGTVEKVLWSPDGDSIAVAGSGGVYLYDAQTLSETQYFDPGAWVNNLAYSPDGQLLAVGTATGMVNLYDTAEEQLLDSFKVGAEAVNALAFDPEGNYLAAGGESYRLVIWDVKTKQIKNEYHFLESISSLAYSPDGAMLASASYGGRIYLREAGTGRLIDPVLSANGLVENLVFSPDGKVFIAAGGKDDATPYDPNFPARLWNASTGKMIKPLGSAYPGIRCASFSPDGRWLATGGNDQEVTLWYAVTYTRIIGMPGHRSIVTSLSFSPDGRYLASGGKDARVIIWDMGTRKIVKSIPGFTTPVKVARLNPDGKIMATGGYDGFTRLWDLDTGEMVKEFGEHTGVISGMAFNSSGKILATSTEYEDRFIYLWDVLQRQYLGTTGGNCCGYKALAFRPHFDWLASYETYSSDITVWSTGGNIIHKVPGSDWSITSLAFSPNGQLLVSGGAEGTIDIWKAETGESVGQIKDEDFVGIENITFSPDGTLLAVSGYPSTIQIWDFLGSQLQQSLSIQENTVYALAFSPDGSLLVSSNGGPPYARNIHSELQIWEVASGRLLTTIDGYRDALVFAGFTPDGRSLVTAGYDGVIRIWEADTGE